MSQPLHAPRQGRIFTPVPAIDYFLGLAYAAGCPPESPRTELATLPKDEAIADGVWQALEIERCKDVVVFNTGGAYGSAKHWPTEYYVELARRIVEREDAAVLVICGPGERDNAAEIERSARHPRVKSMAEQDLSLGVAKACVRRSRLMVTTDSGPRQFAPAFGVPVVSLFGPIDPRWSETHFAGETTLIHPVPCGPCGASGRPCSRPAPAASTAR